MEAELRDQFAMTEAMTWKGSASGRWTLLKLADMAYDIGPTP